MSKILKEMFLDFPDDHDEYPGLNYQYQKIDDNGTIKKRQRSWNPSEGHSKPDNWDTNPSDELPVPAKTPEQANK